MALLVFFGGPCNTISKYKSTSIKGADTLPSSPNSAHLYSHPSPLPRASALGTQKEKSGVGPALGEGPAEWSPQGQAFGGGQGRSPKAFSLQHVLGQFSRKRGTPLSATGLSSEALCKVSSSWSHAAPRPCSPGLSCPSGPCRPPQMPPSQPPDPHRTRT